LHRWRRLAATASECIEEEAEKIWQISMAAMFGYCSGSLTGTFAVSRSAFE
jgi:hypothetical protein